MLTENSIAAFLGERVQVVTGDITLLATDAIVNAANSSLLGGGGVDGAIHRAGGPAILAECEEIRRTRYPDGLPAGEAVITTGGELPAKHVIHTVGPIYGRHDGNEPQLLANCYANSLNLAADGKLAAIAFPAISTGVYGYPKREAAPVVAETIKAFLAKDSTIEKVLLIFFQRKEADIFFQHQTF